MPLHLEEFGREQLQGYIENVPQRKPDALAQFMPDDESYDVEFMFDIIKGGYGQMASITAWDGASPLRDKDVLNRMTAELAKVSHSYRLTEKELLMFNRSRSDAEKQKAVDSVYQNTDKLVYGVQDRAKWFRARAVYHGTIEYNEDNAVLNVDYDLENVIASGSNADVIGDLRAGLQLFKDENDGDLPEVMHMTGKTETALLTSEQVKNHVYGSATDTRIVKSDDLRALFTSLGLPAYAVVDDKVKGDDGAMQQLLPDNRVVFLGGEIGKLVWGPTIENDYEPGIYSIPEIRTTNPPQQAMFVGGAMFPAIERPSQIVHVNLTF